MPDDRTVLDHLLEGRDALQREVLRLTAAIEQLDSVLGRIGSTVARDSAPNPSADAAGTITDTIDSLAGTGSTVPAPVAAVAQPVNPPVEVEPEPTIVPSRPRAVRKAPAKKASRQRRPAGTSAEPPKSIRVHVLEMLQAENRDFGLAEIIDRVHDAGIQAHDDAVRSITIKLMKDGRVERVGRGQYRLARRGSATRASAAVATAPRVTESAPEPVSAAPESPAEPTAPEPATAQAATPEATAPEPAAAEMTTYPTYAPDASTPYGSGPESDAPDTSASEAPVPEAGEPDVDEPEAATPELDAEPGPADPGFAEESVFDATQRDHAPGTASRDEPTERSAYAPSLNLGQPWNS